MPLICAVSPDAWGDGDLVSGTDSGGPLTAQGWTVATAPSGTCTIATSARHPGPGYGGSDKVFAFSGGNWGDRYRKLLSPALWAPQADGILCFHFLDSGTSTALSYDWTFASLYAGAQEVARLVRKTTGVVEQWYWNGSAMVLKQTSTATITNGSWCTVALHFATDAAGGGQGRIQLSIDGGTAQDSGAFTMGSALSWDGLRLWGVGWGYHRFTQIAVYDDPSLDDALTTPKWIACLRPDSDAASGSFTGGFAEVDEVNYSAADEASTTTNPDEIRFGVTSSTIDPAWAPPTIDGVVPVITSTGEGTLATIKPVISSASGASKVTGAAVTNTTTPKTQALTAHTADPATSGAWTTALIDGLEFGMATP